FGTIPPPEPPAQPKPYAQGSTLVCPYDWQGDLPEAHLYRAPQTVTYTWSRNGAAIAGATGATMIANEAGRYGCTETAPNGAGSATSGASFEVVQPVTVKLVPVPGPKV